MAWDAMTWRSRRAPLVFLTASSVDNLLLLFVLLAVTGPLASQAALIGYDGRRRAAIPD